MEKLMRTLITIATTLMLCSCSSRSIDDTSIGPTIYGRSLLKNVNFDVYEGAHDADQELVDAAHQVSKTLDDLSRVQYSQVKESDLPVELDADKIGLADLGTVDWSGPVEPMLKQLAKASNYKIRIMGRKPAIPVLISVNKTNATLAEIIRDITYQAGKQASIQIYPKSHTIELRYHQI